MTNLENILNANDPLDREQLLGREIQYLDIDGRPSLGRIRRIDAPQVEKGAYMIVSDDGTKLPAGFVELLEP